MSNNYVDRAKKAIDDVYNAATEKSMRCRQLQQISDYAMRAVRGKIDTPQKKEPETPKSKAPIKKKAKEKEKEET